MSSIKIYNCDCMEMLKNTPDSSIDLIITDPPYEISCTGGGGNQGHKIATMGADLVDLNINTGYDIRKVGKEIVRVMKKMNVYFWCNKKQIPDYFDFYVKELGCKFDILTWNKCLSPDTKLITMKPTNEIKMIDLKTLSRIDGITSYKVFNGKQFVPIKNIIKTQHETWYEIILSNGNVIKCSGNHKFYINQNEVLAEKLKINDVLDYIKSDYPFKQDNNYISDNIAWLCGFYLANGSGLYSGKRDISLAFNKNKTWIYDKIKLCCEEYPSKFNYFESGDNRATFIISSDIIKGIIKQFIIGKNAYEKHLTHYAYNTSKRILDNLLKGYLDGDGHYDVTGERYRLNFTGKNNLLADDLRTLCYILNYRILLRKSFAKIGNKKFKSYTGQIRLNNEIDCREKSPYTIKNIIIHKTKHNFYDISIDSEDHLFVLHDGTLTHNCNPVPTYSNKYLTDTEYCLYFRNGGMCSPKNYEDAKTYWNDPINAKDKQLWEHPTIKPQHMIEKLIRNSSTQGQFVMDLYLGSGTTAAACKKLNRNFIGSEINEKYYNIALKRVEETVQETEDEQSPLTEFFE